MIILLINRSFESLIEHLNRSVCLSRYQLFAAIISSLFFEYFVCPHLTLNYLCSSFSLVCFILCFGCCCCFVVVVVVCVCVCVCVCVVVCGVFFGGGGGERD